MPKMKWRTMLCRPWGLMSRASRPKSSSTIPLPFNKRRHLLVTELYQHPLDLFQSTYDSQLL